jgi:hypothetical protein
MFRLRDVDFLRMLVGTGGSHASVTELTGTVEFLGFLGRVGWGEGWLGGVVFEWAVWLLFAA